MGILKIQQMAENMGNFAQGPEVQIGLAIVSTVFGVMQQQQQAEAAQEQANYQASIAATQAQIDKNAGISRQNELNYEAANARTEAGQERAAAQQAAIKQQRETALTASRARAVAGSGASDPGVVDVMGQLETIGKYNESVALFQGEDKARGFEDVSNIKTFEGKMARDYGANAANIDMSTAAMYRAEGANDAAIGGYKAFGTVLSGMGGIASSDAGQTMYNKYGTETWANGDPFRGGYG